MATQDAEMFKGNEGAPNARRKRREIPHSADSPFGMTTKRGQSKMAG
jgi:hypothetical protein